MYKFSSFSLLIISAEKSPQGFTLTSSLWAAASSCCNASNSSCFCIISSIIFNPSESGQLSVFSISRFSRDFIILSIWFTNWYFSLILSLISVSFSITWSTPSCCKSFRKSSYSLWKTRKEYFCIGIIICLPPIVVADDF